MTLRRPPRPYRALVGHTPEDRDRIALALLQRARLADSGVCAVWFGGGRAIAITRTPYGDREAITWREADRLAFPEKYIERKPAKSASAPGKISSAVQKL